MYIMYIYGYNNYKIRYIYTYTVSGTASQAELFGASRADNHPNMHHDPSTYTSDALGWIPISTDFRASRSSLILVLVTPCAFWQTPLAKIRHVIYLQPNWRLYKSMTRVYYDTIVVITIVVLPQVVLRHSEWNPLEWPGQFFTGSDELSKFCR